MKYHSCPGFVASLDNTTPSNVHEVSSICIPGRCDLYLASQYSLVPYFGGGILFSLMLSSSSSLGLLFFGISISSSRLLLPSPLAEVSSD